MTILVLNAPRRASLLTIAMVLLATAAPAAAGQLAAIHQTTTARATPASSGEARGTAAKGDTYAVYRAQGEWVEVQFDGRKAWLKRSDVSLREAALKQVQASALNVRTGPGVRHAALGTLPRGASVAERGGNGVWSKVSFRGRSGWVLGRHLVSERAARAGLTTAVTDASNDDRGGESGDRGGESGDRGAEPSDRGPESSTSRADAWENGRRLGPIEVVTIDGKPVARRTAEAFLRMREAASRDGVALRVVSGFRSYAEQAELYRRYRAGTGNLAAAPGRSNHQSGLALDLNTSTRGVYAWLNRNAARFGFRRTVPSEAWHWELR